jgi:hypothetical protein
MEDAWNVSLWDIYPSCQISGIAENDTVIIDGAYGASIRWKSFTPIATVTRETWGRYIVKIAFRGSPVLLYMGALFVSLGRGQFGNKIFLGIGAFFLVVSIITFFLSPALIRILYTGKFWNTQALFFGFEGHLDLQTIEKCIFGTNYGRFHWSAAGSSLSGHRNERGECIGLDPTVNPDVRDEVRRVAHSPYGGEKIFTLVDTFTMTVTMFKAKRPPVAVFLCGTEGGMQRAIMCSYDWRTQTLYRETVLRMETPVLERMSRVPRFRFGLKREMEAVEPLYRLHGLHKL